MLQEYLSVHPRFSGALHLAPMPSEAVLTCGQRSRTGCLIGPFAVTPQFARILTFFNKTLTPHRNVGSSHDWVRVANRRAAGESRQPRGRVPGTRRSLFGDRATFAPWLVRDPPEKARLVGGDRRRAGVEPQSCWCRRDHSRQFRTGPKYPCIYELSMQ